MSLIQLKAKVLLFGEDEMETESKNEELGIAKEGRWLWRRTAIDANNIWKIVSYSSTKSLVFMVDGEKLLVQEPFVDVLKKWKEAYDMAPDLEIETEINQIDENNPEEEED